MNKHEPLPNNFRRFRSTVPAGELGEGDGIAPKYEARRQEFNQSRDKPDYAVQRLGAQMLQALTVEPLLPGLETFVFAELRQVGTSNSYTLRREIARAITRKRVPELVFEVLPPGVRI